MQRRTFLTSAAATAIAAGAIGRGIAAEPVTLTVWATDQLAQPPVAKVWNTLKANFEAANPGVTIKYMAPTGMIDNGAVQAAIQSSAGPDVLLTNSGLSRVTTVVNAKLIQPLTEQYEKLGWKAKLYPWLYDILATQRGGQIYEVPDGVDAIGLWYHKDLFEKNGWKITGSWADFEALLGELHKAGLEPQTVGARNGANGGHFFGNYLQSAAGSAVMGEVVSGKRPWTDPAPLLGAQRVVAAVKNGNLSSKMTGLNDDAAIRLWTNKRAGIFFGGPGYMDRFRGNGYDMDNIGYATVPSDLKGESKPTGGIGWSWMVPVSSKQPELAVKWIDYTLSDEAMRFRAEQPVGAQIWPRELKDIKPAVAVMSDVLADAAGGIGYNPSVYVPGAALATYYQVIQGLIGGQVSAEDGMKLIQSKMSA